MRDVADHPAACWLQPAASADACAPSLAPCPACGEPMGCNGRYPRGCGAEAVSAPDATRALLPCPFCGGKAAEWTPNATSQGVYPHGGVVCLACGLLTYLTPEQWNRRMADAPEPSLTEVAAYNRGRADGLAAFQTGTATDLPAPALPALLEEMRAEFRKQHGDSVADEHERQQAQVPEPGEDAFIERQVECAPSAPAAPVLPAEVRSHEDLPEAAWAKRDEIVNCDNMFERKRLVLEFADILRAEANAAEGDRVNENKQAGERREAFQRFSDAVRRTLDRVAEAGGYSDTDVTALHRAARAAFNGRFARNDSDSAPAPTPRERMTR